MRWLPTLSVAGRSVVPPAWTSGPPELSRDSGSVAVLRSPGVVEAGWPGEAAPALAPVQRTSVFGLLCRFALVSIGFGPGTTVLAGELAPEVPARFSCFPAVAAATPAFACCRNGRAIVGCDSPAAERRGIGFFS